jgi:hypothetical protein
VGGVMSYPAVGMLIFASCPDVSIRTGSHLFNSPRPCPQSRESYRQRGLTICRVLPRNSDFASTGLFKKRRRVSGGPAPGG